MFSPRSTRIFLFAALGIVINAVPVVVGQMDWKKVPTPIGPSGRVNHGMAYDAARQRVVLFGGSGGKLFDTWEWNGLYWRDVTLARGNPPGRYEHAMAYDAARQRVVLFGGWSGGPRLNDTWEWDGNTWRNVTPLNPNDSPPARTVHALAYDAARRLVVLFGGLAGAAVLGDTWEWNGIVWRNVTPSNRMHSPSARRGHAMAYDAAMQQVVLFGGGPVFSNDTWEWDGNIWTRQQSSASPGKRYGHALAYDTARQRIVLFGGWHNYNDTWEWEGKTKTWYQRNLSTSPSQRTGHGMVYDAARGSMVMFSGWSGSATIDETWTYTPTDMTASARIVSAAAGGKVTFNLDAGSAHKDKSYFVVGSIDTGKPRGMSLGNVTLLLNQDGYFWFTALFPNTLILNSLGTLDSSGKATATVQVPPGLTALIGTRFYHAYIVFKAQIDYASTPVSLTFMK